MIFTLLRPLRPLRSFGVAHALPEKLRDFVAALPRWASVVKISSHETQKNQKIVDF
jgi:hypothetical protein